jgi:hypothetical protein
VRWIGCFVAVCLLFAGAATDRARLDRYQHSDELDNIPALAKLAARRLEGSRPASAIKLEPFTIVAGDEPACAVRGRIERAHERASTPSTRTYVLFDARGPPSAG